MPWMDCVIRQAAAIPLVAAGEGLFARCLGHGDSVAELLQGQLVLVLSLLPLPSELRDNLAPIPVLEPHLVTA